MNRNRFQELAATATAIAKSLMFPDLKGKLITSCAHVTQPRECIVLRTR